MVATGRITTYPSRSRYQLIVDRLAPAGIGALMALLDERRRRLAAEGLFAAERKRPLPFLPEVIGLVTSPTGAVIRDILHRLGERFPRRVLLWPVLVQGELAAEQVAAAIAGFNALAPGGAVPRPDLLIVARGGGSLEDLWAFNEEVVVRAAAASAIPLISAVGHETDTTLIDLAADQRAPTPTAAAELAVPVRTELALRLGQLRAAHAARRAARAAAARAPGGGAGARPARPGEPGRPGEPAPGRSGRAPAAQPCGADRARRPQPRRGRRPARLARPPAGRGRRPPAALRRAAPLRVPLAAARAHRRARPAGRAAAPGRARPAAAAPRAAGRRAVGAPAACDRGAACAMPASGCARRPACSRASAIRACWRAASPWCATSTAELVDSAARARAAGRARARVPRRPRPDPAQRRAAPAVRSRPAASRSGCCDGGGPQRHRAPAQGHGAPARSGRRLPLGPRAGFREHRPLHDRGGLRGRRCDRAAGLRRSRGRARRPAAAGGLSRPDGQGGRPLRLRGGRRADRRQDDPPPSARVRRGRGRERRGAEPSPGRTPRPPSARQKRGGRRSEHPRRRAARPAGADPRAEAAAPRRPGRLRLAGDRRRCSPSSRRSWPRCKPSSRPARRTSAWRTRSATCCSPRSTSPAISASTARAALRRANEKFERRFRAIEAALRAAGRRLEDASLDEMEALWQAAKAAD